MRPIEPEEVLELRDIPREGLDLALDLSGRFATWALADTEASPGASAATATLHASRIGRDVYLKGALGGSLELPCSRCTAAARLTLDVPLEMTIVPAPEPSEAPAAEVELTDEDLDFATYTEEKIALAAILREQLLLALPIAHLCREDCAGLCPRCGQDLNVGRCECPPEPRDDRWAALRNVKL